jgi:hypothetical protein
MTESASTTYVDELTHGDGIDATCDLAIKEKKANGSGQGVFFWDGKDHSKHYTKCWRENLPNFKKYRYF